MPCNIVVRVELSSPYFVKKALDELGIVYKEDSNGNIVFAGGSYSSTNHSLSCQNTTRLSQIQQRYGLLVAESNARTKGWKTRRDIKDNGDIQLQLRRA